MKIQISACRNFNAKFKKTCNMNFLMQNNFYFMISPSPPPPPITSIIKNAGNLSAMGGGVFKVHVRVLPRAESKGNGDLRSPTVPPHFRDPPPRLRNPPH